MTTGSDARAGEWRATAAALVQRHRDAFQAGQTRPLAFRREQLRRLRQALDRRERQLLEALHRDLGKPPAEAVVAELGVVAAELDRAARHLPRWMRPGRRSVAPIAWPGRASVVPEPLGVALILGPWNYPVQLLLSPLVGAIAAGNCACLKPSELAPHTSRALAELIADALDPATVSVVEGGPETAEALLAERFDVIFFTGSAAVGRRVMAAAARYLTPVVLELGGKCPCLVMADACLDTAARRILWGKGLNAGQTCVAPDYVLVQRAATAPLLEAFRRAARQFFGDDPRRSPHVGRIVSRAHFDRLVGYLGAGRCVLGGDHDAAERFLAPTLLLNPPADAPVMQEEIFGPILPIVEFDHLDAVLRDLRARPKPLALYLFGKDRRVRERVVAETSSGGVCVNDTITHIVTPQLPFGGVGDSGMGAYHGRASFDCFSHAKSVLVRGTRWDPRWRYPPAGAPLPVLKRAIRWLLGW